MDIAGFGKPQYKFKISIFNSAYIIFIECLEDQPNTFDQLCINYTNEVFQQFFVQRMIIVEKQYYEGLDIPSVPFFDNSEIVGEYL